MLSKLTGANTVWWLWSLVGVWTILRVGVKAIDQALVALPISGRRIAGSGAGTP
jgi:hypothetical protein